MLECFAVLDRHTRCWTCSLSDPPVYSHEAPRSSLVRRHGAVSISAVLFRTVYLARRQSTFMYIYTSSHVAVARI